MSRPNLTHLIHSMLLEGLDPLEIHRIITGAGYPPAESWLLIERIAFDLSQLKIGSRPDHTQRAVEEALSKFKTELLEQIAELLTREKRKRS